MKRYISTYFCRRKDDHFNRFISYKGATTVQFNNDTKYSCISTPYNTFIGEKNKFIFNAPNTKAKETFFKANHKRKSIIAFNFAKKLIVMFFETKTYFTEAALGLKFEYFIEGVE